MNSAIIIPLFSGAFGALLVAFITIHHQRKVFVGTLKEKWICDLRNEIAMLVGLSENLRLLWVSPFTSASMGIVSPEMMNLYHRLVEKKQKIHMLLNDNGDQKKLYELIAALVKLADGAASSPKGYEKAENNVVTAARILLRNEWHAISKIQRPKTWKVVLVFLEILLFAGLVFLEIQSKGVRPIF
jgi:hypothetical protein